MWIFKIIFKNSNSSWWANLLEDAGDRVVGDPLRLPELPGVVAIAVLVIKGRKGGSFEEAALEFVEAVVVVVKGLVLFGLEDMGEVESVSPCEEVDDLGSLDEVTAEVKMGK